MNGSVRLILLTLLMLPGLSPVLAEESGWPRTVDLDGGTVTIYEPQVDEMSDDFIRFRAALAYREEPGDEPVFGAGWFESDVQVDRLSGTVHPVDLMVTQTRFPIEADVQTRLSEAMARPGFASNFSFSLAEFEQSEKITRAETEAAEQLKTAPPTIIYRDKPALLVNIDGTPILREIENSPYKAVINTPYPLISDGRTYYLNVAEDIWYRADEPTGPFRFEQEPPEAIAALVNTDEQAFDTEALALSEKVTATNAPEIVVSTEPAELIVTDGPAAFVPLVDDLLVLNNSDDDVFMHLGEQAYYIVLAGRWYTSRSLAGPWAFRDAETLPEAFALIPGDSDQADSRVHVAGTEEAQEAVLDAQVPQTAAVQRGETDIEVQYDGEPVFAPVDGTDMAYATNTGSTVILSDGLYYLVEDGVWYVSTSLDGPWQVAVARPDQVRVILPSSPVYNVKYVYVYGYTPDVVYVGYTPGYMGSYVYRSTVFYGSGWYYRPWVSPYRYYPYHRTWGFHVRYDPWYGWNFGLSWAWGPFGFSYWPGGYWHHHHHWHHRHYSYWGPHGYRPRHHHHRPYHGSPGYRPPGHRPPGYRPHPYERHHNLYRDEGQRALIADSRDKPARTLGRRRGDGEFVSKAYAKHGFDRNMPKEKAAYATSRPVSRSDLAAKAKSSATRFGKGRNGNTVKVKSKTYSKAFADTRNSSGTAKALDRKLSRNDIALKARSADQSYRNGSKTGVSAGGSSRMKSIKTPGGKVNTTDLALLKASKAKTRAMPVTRTKAQSAIPKAKQVVKSPSRKPATRSSAPSSVKTMTGAPVQASKAKTYSRAKSMPVVKLTRPSKPSSTGYSKPRTAPAPARQTSRQQPQKKYSHSPPPKQSVPSNPPRQKQSAPARSKQKQQRVK